MICWLIRDCLRLIHHIAGKNSPKSISLKRIVKAEFKKNAKQTDKQVPNYLLSLYVYVFMHKYNQPIFVFPFCQVLLTVSR